MITLTIEPIDSGSSEQVWTVRMNIPWQGGKMCPAQWNLDTKELENLYTSCAEVLEKPNETLREQMAEFIRSIAEHDRYIAYNELPNATYEEQELHAYKFDAEVLRLIEARAKELTELNQRGT